MHNSDVNCPPRDSVLGKVMIAGRFSKTVAFVAILAALTFGALATASAQPAESRRSTRPFRIITRAETTPPPRSMHRSLSGWLRTASEPIIQTTLLRSTNWASWVKPRASTAEAEGLFKRALAIREKALGASHPDVGQTLNNLANVYRDQGKYSGGGGSSSARWRSARKRSVRTTPTWARLSTTWPRV